MDMFLDYLWVFLIGGLVCMIGEILIITTNMTSARILVSFVLVGVLLEAVGVFKYISDFADRFSLIGSVNIRDYRDIKLFLNRLKHFKPFFKPRTAV